jgi:hypothetical protein
MLPLWACVRFVNIVSQEKLSFSILQPTIEITNKLLWEASAWRGAIQVGSFRKSALERPASAVNNS